MEAHTAAEVRIVECAGLFALAATPVFAAMAVWTGCFGNQPVMLCMAAQGSSPMDGMTLMYALMSIFHLPPWLRLISNRWIGGAGRCRATFRNVAPSTRP